jgi:hypothetical protein
MFTIFRNLIFTFDISGKYAYRGGVFTRGKQSVYEQNRYLEKRLYISHIKPIWHMLNIYVFVSSHDRILSEQSNQNECYSKMTRYIAL